MAHPAEPSDVVAWFTTDELATLGDDPGWRASDDERPRILADAATTRLHLVEQAAEAIRPLTENEQAQLDAIRAAQRERLLAHAIGQDLEPFLAEASGPVQWFGPIVENGLAAFQGAPESFKTIAALQLGLAGAAGGSWLGLELGEPRPFVYVANEKSRATVRDRLERMSARIRPLAPVRIVHRAGVTFGDREGWDRVVELVATYGPRTFVVCDTVASLAGPGFDENSGKDMAVALAALRRIGDAGGTVAAVHHPNKHGDGTGGIRLRGHSSLWGEVDGVLEFTRPDRSVEAGVVRIEPKDGDLRLFHFRWDRETFLLDAQGGVLPASTSSIAAVVDGLYDGDPLTAERIRAEFPGHGRTVMLAKLAEAAEAGLIARVGRGKATGYVPVPRVLRTPDDTFPGPDGRMADDPTGPRTNEPANPGRKADEGNGGRIVRGGGSIGTPAGRFRQPEPNPVRPPCVGDVDMFDAHASARYMVDGRECCDLCTPPATA